MSKLRESIKKTFICEDNKLYYIVKDTVVTDKVFANNPSEAKQKALKNNPYKFDGKQIMDPYEYDRRFGDGNLGKMKYAVSDGKAIDAVVADTKEEASSEFDKKVSNYDEVLTFDEFLSKYNRTPDEDLADLYDDSFIDDPSVDLWDPGMP